MTTNGDLVLYFWNDFINDGILNFELFCEAWIYFRILAIYYISSPC